MTISTSSKLHKSQDCVESDVIRVISGVNVRRFVYLIYVFVSIISTTVLYLFPTAIVIVGFIILQLLLLLSIYPLVKFALKTEDYDVVWDHEGFHWFHQSNIAASEPPIQQPYTDGPSSSPTNYYLSHMFI
ncbi:unnamed protein product [Angiostrongylus costaricensis]|uniref:Transmembrane protein n=1 Tax=Angiostrongylus costaricensis TaxID=334426 RepID=A0A0R3PV91_ANGCS|nr:unnamed protein product [Angiostrongylus costaricensis]